MKLVDAYAEEDERNNQHQTETKNIMPDDQARINIINKCCNAIFPSHVPESPSPKPHDYLL